MSLPTSLTDAIQAYADQTAQQVADYYKPIVADQAQQITRLEAIIAAGEDPDPQPPTTTGVKWGMSSPDTEWSTRLREIGPGLKARRVFSGSLNILGGVRAALDGGLHPVASIKLGGWQQAAAGAYDKYLDALARDLAALNQPLTLAIHHEPGGKDDQEGGTGSTLADWSNMQLHCLPRIKKIAPLVDVAVIDNGFKFDDKINQGFTYTDLDAIYEPLLPVIDVFAADCYHGGTTTNPGRAASTKIAGMTRYANHLGWTGKMGIGEYNGLDAKAITAAHTAIKADPRFAWACIFNSAVNNRDGVNWVLTGDRLAAFRTVLAP